MNLLTTPKAGVISKQKKEATQPPPMYQVVLLNDDYTPMEFVMMIIQEVFHKDVQTSKIIMLTVHKTGRATCGIYSRDIAATKIKQVLQHAQKAGHPLQCIMEKI